MPISPDRARGLTALPFDVTFTSNNQLLDVLLIPAGLEGVSIWLLTSGSDVRVAFDVPATSTTGLLVKNNAQYEDDPVTIRQRVSVFGQSKPRVWGVVWARRR